jgi:hypothetical protein
MLTLPDKVSKFSLETTCSKCNHYNDVMEGTNAILCSVLESKRKTGISCAV